MDKANIMVDKEVWVIRVPSATSASTTSAASINSARVPSSLTPFHQTKEEVLMTGKIPRRRIIMEVLEEWYSLTMMWHPLKNKKEKRGSNLTPVKEEITLRMLLKLKVIRLKQRFLRIQRIKKRKKNLW